MLVIQKKSLLLRSFHVEGNRPHTGANEETNVARQWELWWGQQAEKEDESEWCGRHGKGTQGLRRRLTVERYHRGEETGFVYKRPLANTEKNTGRFYRKKVALEYADVLENARSMPGSHHVSQFHRLKNHNWLSDREVPFLLARGWGPSCPVLSEPSACAAVPHSGCEGLLPGEDEELQGGFLGIGVVLGLRGWVSIWRGTGMAHPKQQIAEGKSSGFV